MHSLYTFASGKTENRKVLGKSEKLSVYYHDFFDYPLTFSDLIKWKVGQEGIASIKSNKNIISKDGFYFLEGKGSSIYKRLLRIRVSAKKMEIAKKASFFLAVIPGIKMIAVTGSLAMANAADGSDIDLMIITKKGWLWTTRLVSYLFIWLAGIQTRKASDKTQKDKLCLNMWMDESDLSWKRQDRNIYTAHEISQILPLVNKNGTYENFLHANGWVKTFWPNAIRGNEKRSVKKDEIIKSSISGFPLKVFENLAFGLQYLYMKSKITRETVTKTRAIFHPQDWGKLILSRLN